MGGMNFHNRVSSFWHWEALGVAALPTHTKYVFTASTPCMTTVFILYHTRTGTSGVTSTALRQTEQNTYTSYLTTEETNATKGTRQFLKISPIKSLRKKKNTTTTLGQEEGWVGKALAVKDAVKVSDSQKTNRSQADVEAVCDPCLGRQRQATPMQTGLQAS